MTASDGVEYTPGELDRDATFYVAGHRGLVGSAIVRKLEASGFQRIVGKSSAELDLKDRDAVFAYMSEIKPTYVVLAEDAASVDTAIAAVEAAGGQVAEVNVAIGMVTTSAPRRPTDPTDWRPTSPAPPGTPPTRPRPSPASTAPCSTPRWAS